MKLSAAFGILPELMKMIQIGLLPTLMTIWRQPSLLLDPQKLSQTFMGHLWTVYGSLVDEGGRPIKQALITPHAAGVVLDLGAGCGHAASYLDRSRVKKYVAVEPNAEMHAQLRTNATIAGFNESDRTLLIICCGAADTSSILSSLEHVQVDTIISVLALCSIPDPRDSITSIVCDVLKPEGHLLYYEHVLSPIDDVAWYQRFWAPLWAIWSGGCRIDSPTDLYVDQIKDSKGNQVWEDKKVWRKEGEPEEYLFSHRAGHYIKR